MSGGVSTWPVEGTGGGGTTGDLTDTGTDGIVITGGTGAVNGSGTQIAQHVADATHPGYLSAADWVAFNGKISGVDTEDAGIPVTTASTTLNFTGAGVTVTDLGGGVAGIDIPGTSVSAGDLTDAGTDGIIITGGTGAVLGTGTSIAQHVADVSHNGYLSSTDWATFNAKGSGSVTDVSVVTAHGFAGTIATSTTTPAITLSTTITGILQGDGTSISAATTTGTGAVVLASAPTMANPVVGTQTQGDNSTKAASTSYVDTAIANAVAGINPAVAVQAATTAAGDTSGFTYNNGVSGVGATLTGSTNTPFIIDGFTFTAVGQRALIKNDTQSPSGAFNGIYFVSQIQTSLLPPILTRALDYDTPANMNNTGSIPVINGTVNGTTSWVLTSQVVTVGTSPLTYTEFTKNPAAYLLVANNLSDVASKSTSFNNISPVTTTGDLIYSASGATNSRLAIGSTGNVLTVVGGVPAWAPSSGGGGTVQTARFMAGAGVADANTIALLNFDLSTVVDYAPTPSTWTIPSGSSGGGTPKFGPGAATCANASVARTSSSKAIGTTAWTIEFWFAASSAANSQGFTETGTGTGEYDFHYDNGHNLIFRMAGTTIITAAYTMPDTAYHHYAVVNNAGTVTIYVDGTSVGTGSTGGRNLSATSQQDFGSAAGLGAQGFLDEVRTSNIARYTSNFTSPTSAFPITNTITVNTNSFISSVVGGLGAGVCTINFAPGIFTTEPVGTVTVINAATGINIGSWSTTPTTSSVGLITLVNSVAANTLVDVMFQ